MAHYTPESIDWLQHALTPGMGTSTFWHWVETVKNSSVNIDFPKPLSLRKHTIPPLISLSKVHHVIETMDKLNGRIIFFQDQAYPPLLRTLADPPPILYCLGKTELLKSPSLAIVGGRNACLSGQVFTKKISTNLSNTGLCITSGLARGIDQSAHYGALSGIGRSIAVLAGGVDVVYPLQNKDLYERMKNEGLLISEMPPHTAPTAQLFPKRNRIVSGLSAGVVVIEAALKSGSLITARCALEQNREVMAVPGFPSDPRHHGTNHLIRQGAALVESADDVLAHMGDVWNMDIRSIDLPAKHSPQRPLEGSVANNEFTQQLLNYLGATPIDIDVLIRHSGFPPHMIIATLSELELTGQVSRTPGGQVLKIAMD